MSGIQVDPSSGSQHAMMIFGDNYAKMVMQLAEHKAFSEAAQTRVNELEAELTKTNELVGRQEGALNEAQRTIQELSDEASQLRAAAQEFQPSSESSSNS